jgi:aminoglycoside phosphotransferase (APT) family kinase protein
MGVNSRQAEDGRAEILDFLAAHGLLDPLGFDVDISPLGGGVSSDIWRIAGSERAICVKRALPRLKVERLWQAPVIRNKYEALWLIEANRHLPGAAPEVLARDDKGTMFAMAWLDPTQYPVWKDKLRDGQADRDFAARVGHDLAILHGKTAGDTKIAEIFATDEIFHLMRPEPYLSACAKHHGDLADRLEALVQQTETTKHCLIHGDVSPKNILVGPGGPVFIDAECAWYGDPAFDLAFCLNHMFLKCLWVAPRARGYLDCFAALAKVYLAGVDWEDGRALERRTAHLLPGLLLGRVDGRSPAEYVTSDKDKDLMRRFARAHLLKPRDRLAELAAAWALEIGS